MSEELWEGPTALCVFVCMKCSFANGRKGGLRGLNPGERRVQMLRLYYRVFNCLPFLYLKTKTSLGLIQPSFLQTVLDL